MPLALLSPTGKLRVEELGVPSVGPIASHPPAVWFVGKLLFFLLLFIWLRATFPRLRSDQLIDPAVGFTDIVEMGTPVQRGTPLLRIHARTEAAADLATTMVHQAISIEDQSRSAPPLVWQRISAQESV